MPVHSALEFQTLSEGIPAIHHAELNVFVFRFDVGQVDADCLLDGLDAGSKLPLVLLVLDREQGRLANESVHVQCTRHRDTQLLAHLLDLPTCGSGVFDHHAEVGQYSAVWIAVSVVCWVLVR